MATRPVSVLYIDDDLALSRLVQRNLTRRGYVVELAGNAADGFARLAAGGIDVIALDHFLPVGTGIDFLKELARQNSQFPVVYVTAAGDTSVAVAALKAGAADYVAKTVGDEFLELLTNAIDQSLEKAQLKRARERAERDLREAKDRAEVLLHEVNHRVANSLALVVALVQLQARTLSDPSVRDTLVEVQTRILAIAGVHRSLYTSDDVRSVEISDYFSNLLNELQRSLGASHNDLKFVLLAEPVRVPTDKAVLIGVIVTELVTNAFKYAYPDNAKGEIRVIFRETENGSFKLTVEDDGVGLMGTTPPQGTGVGSRIVRSLAQSLGATIEFAGSNGCCTSLEFAVKA